MRQAEVASLRADVGRLERALQEAPAVVAEQETRLEQLKVEGPPPPAPSAAFCEWR